MQPQSAPLSLSVIADISSYYGREVVRGVGKFVSQRPRWRLSIVPIWAYKPRLLREATALVIQATTQQMFQDVQAADLPAVNVADNLPLSPLPAVRSDHLEVGQLCAQHLLGRGFRNFAFCGQSDDWYAQQRLEGLKLSLRDAGLSPAELWVRMDKPEWRVRMREFLAQLSKPLALVACHDGWARNAAWACRVQGLRVPQEVAIIGVDNDDLLCELCDPPLSSVAVAAQRIGYEAAALIERLSNKQPLGPCPLIIPPVGVITRRSTDVLAIDDPLVSRALLYIHQHAAEPMTVEQVVRELRLSRRRLEQRFQQVLGRSPATEVRRVRVERAKHLLETTDVALGIIALDCGFADAPRLTKVFRRELGMTPSVYRSRTRLH